MHLDFAGGNFCFDLNFYMYYFWLGSEVRALPCWEFCAWNRLHNFTIKNYFTVKLWLLSMVVAWNFFPYCWKCWFRFLIILNVTVDIKLGAIKVIAVNEIKRQWTRDMFYKQKVMFHMQVAVLHVIYQNTMVI